MQLTRAALLVLVASLFASGTVAVDKPRAASPKPNYTGTWKLNYDRIEWGTFPHRKFNVFGEERVIRHDGDTITLKITQFDAAGSKSVETIIYSQFRPRAVRLTAIKHFLTSRGTRAKMMIRNQSSKKVITACSGMSDRKTTTVPS